MKKHYLWLVALALSFVPFLAAQPGGDTQLKQVIVFGRHGVRSPLLPNSTIDTFAAQPFPVFSSSGGNLTDNGRANETILGGYYRLWLTQEGLLTGNDPADAAFVYVRANGDSADRRHRAGLLGRHAAGGQCQTSPPYRAATRCSIRWTRASRGSTSGWRSPP
jgi:hypothetical protein